MTRGRKPDTTEQQAAKGAPGKRMSAQTAQKIREPKAPAPIAIGKIRPPKWLKRSRKATEVWNDLAPKLERMNLLHDLDASPFARYCRYSVEWITADQAVQKEGVWFDAVDTNGNATKKRHPAFHAIQQLEKILCELEARFGMNPSDRYKIMRDQAAARGLGLLPLWDDETQPNRNEAPAPADDDAQVDIVSVLQSFDSAPPERLN